MIYIFSLITVAFSILIFGNILIYKHIVRKTVREHIDPYFTEQRQLVSSVSFTGFFKTGDFKNKIFEITWTSNNGKMFNNTYTYVFVKDEFGVERRYTARIQTVFFKIYKVTLKSGDQKGIVIF